MPRHLSLALAAVTLLGTGQAAVAAPRKAPRPTVVVAVSDSGINPYHAAFYRPRNTAHPCTYVAGFSCDVPALRLSVGRYADYAKAVAADRAVWDSVTPHRWYWIPRTNIIGAVCDSEFSDLTHPDTGEPTTCILDDNGHGTGTASSIVSEAPDALLLVHEGSTTAADLKTAPVLPDVQSHSWGPPAPLPLHAVDPVLPDSSDNFCDTQRRPESLFFIAAGNEAPFPSIADCDRRAPDIHIVGGGYPGYWTFASWSAFDFASWFCRPVALRGATKGVEDNCGTSFSAPTAAGAVADALLRLRREDGYTGRSTTARVSRTVTRAAFEQALRDAASYTPKAKFTSGTLCTAYVVCTVEMAVYGRNTPLPPGAEHVFWGYGWLDSTITPAIVSCARGRACPPKSAAARQWNDARMQARAASDNQVVQPSPQADAGTQRDAGDDARTAVPIAPGREYTGMVEPYGFGGGDMEDWYAFRARAGQRVSVTSAGYLNPAVPADPTPVAGCWYLVGPDGRSMDPGGATVPLYSLECDSAAVNEPPKDVRVPRTGTYVAVYMAHNGVPPHGYRFSVTLAG